MLRLHNGCARHIAKAVPHHQPRHIAIEMRHIRQAAAQHDHIRVQDIGNHRQGTREPIRMPCQSRLRALIPHRRPRRQGRGITRARPIAIRRQGGAGQEGFKTAMLAAPAAGPWKYSPSKLSGEMSDKSPVLRKASSMLSGERCDLSPVV